MKKSLLVLLTGIIVCFFAGRGRGYANVSIKDSINHYLSVAESFRQTDLYKAEELVSRALDFARKIHEDSSITYLSNKEAKILRLRGSLTSDEYTSNALDSAHQSYNDSIIAHISLRKALILNARGKLTEALPLIDSTKAVFERQNNKHLLAQASLIKGIVLMNTGIAQDAAKELYYATSYPDSSDSLFYARALIQLALLHYYQHPLEKPEKTNNYLLKASALFSKSPYLNHQALGLNYGAIWHILFGDPQKAFSMLEKAIDINETLNNHFNLCINNHNLGFFSNEIKDYTKAEKHLLHTIELCETIGAGLAKAQTYQELSKVYVALKQYDKAIKLLEELKMVCEEKNYLSINTYATGVLSSIYYDRQNYKLAAQYLWKYNFARDSLNSNLFPSNLNIIEQKVKFEKTTKEQEEYIQETIYHSRIQTIILISIILFLGSILTLVYINLRNKRKWLKRFEEKNRIISHQAEEMKGMLHSLNIANQSKEKLLSIIAHDLINPFNTIIGFSELIISNDEYDETQKIFASKINETSKEAYHLLDQLLTWSRIQFNNMKVLKVDTDITKIAKQNYVLYQPTAEAKKIALVDDLKTGVVACTDEIFLSTIIRNLLSNAIKFTREGGHVSISTEKTHHDTAKIVIADTGIGISPKNLEKLLNEKELFSERGTNNEKGTGLGLAICFDFAQKINAEITVESEIEKGTSFTIELPLHEEQPIVGRQI